MVHDFGSPLTVEQVPMPKLGAGQVRVKVEVCGLCHTDIHAANGDWPVKPSPPFTPGHEGVGIVRGRRHRHRARAPFPAALSRHTCECGFPNVVNFPRDGAFVFVWEYLHYPSWGLARVPSRPVRFHVAANGGVRQTCDGSSDTLGFKDAGRVFQIEVYLGPGTGAALRGRVAAMLDSLHVARDP